MMAGENLPPLDLEKLAQSLSKGFEALLDEVKDLAQRETILRKNLEVAKKEVSIPFLLLANIFHDENPKLALDRKSWLPGSCVRERALHVLPDCILLTRVANTIPAIDLLLTIFRNSTARPNITRWFIGTINQSSQCQRRARSRGLRRRTASGSHG